MTDPRDEPSGLTPRHRAAVAVAVGVLCAIYSVILLRRAPEWVSDFDQLWVAARAWRSGQDPYAAVSAQFPYPLFYPFTAVVFVLPFSLLPLAAARCLFVGLGSGLLAYAVLGRGPWMLWLFLGNNVRNALLTAQWSTWLTAAALMPWLGLVFAAKPSLGLAIFGSRPSRRGAVAAGALVVVAFLLWLGWPGSWWTAIHTTAEGYRAPVTRPFGWLLLLALVRWRNPDARLLAFIACVPQTTALYETVELYLVCRTRTEVAILALLSYGVELFAPSYQALPLAERLTAHWPWLFALVYLPALIFVLRPREWFRKLGSGSPWESP